MEDRSFNPIPLLLQEVDRADSSTSPVTISDGVLLRSIRSEPPADFVFKIECFSSLSELGVDSYESGIFEAGDYKWTLSLYPDGDKKRGGDGYISLYLVLVDTNNFPLGWEVNLNFKLFVYDQIRDKYMTIQDLNGKVRRFHKLKSQHGFPKLVSLAILQDESNGYLKNDTCIFGAEVFVIQNKRTPHHCISLSGIPSNLSGIVWKVNNFSKLKKECYYSTDVLSLGERKWKFEIYPKGDRLNKGRLSVHLQMVDSGASFGFGFNFMRWFQREKQASSTHLPFPHDGGFLLDFYFLVTDQLHDNHLMKIVSHSLDANWNTSTSIKCGDLMLLSDLMDESNGFLVNDSLILQAGYHVVCEVKNT